MIKKFCIFRPLSDEESRKNDKRITADVAALKKKNKESSKKSKDSNKKTKAESSEKEIKKKKDKDGKKHKAEAKTTCDNFDLMVDVSDKSADQKDRFIGEYESVEVDKKPKKRGDGDKKEKKESDGKTKSRSKKVKSGKSEEESESGKRKKSSKKGINHNCFIYNVTFQMTH